MLLIPHVSWCQSLTGKVVDSKSNAIEFANVALYDKDSTFLVGTVTDSCGVFVVNCSKNKASYLKVSCVGYCTQIVTVSNEKKYNVTLQQDNVMLKDIIVKGHLPKYNRVPGGYSVAINNSILEKLFSANDILSSLPRVTGSNGNFFVFGKGTPEIYINNRKLRDKYELAHLKPSDIDKITILTNPGVKYDSEVKSVIIIKTKKTQGEGLSGSVDGVYGQKNKASYDSNINLNWRSSKFDLFGSLGHSNNYDCRKQEVEQTIHGYNHEINEKMSDMYQTMRTKNILGIIGANYLLNDSNSVGASYHISKSLQSQHMHSVYSDSLFADSKLQDNINYRMNAVPSSGPTHEVDAYYNGKIHDLKITFDGTYYQSKQKLQTTTEEFGSNGAAYINSKKMSNSKLFASKLIISTNLSNNLSIDFGAEYNISKYHQNYANKEGIIESKDNQIKENNVAGLLSADYSFNDFELTAGIRYEHSENSKYENGIKQSDVSRIYNRLYPNVDFSYNGENFNLGLSYEVTSEKPSYGDLSSVVAYNSRYFYEGGNPNLNMTLEHTIELSGSYKNLSFSLSYEIDKDAITKWGQLYNPNGDIILLTNINVPTLKMLYFSLSAEPSIAFWHPLFELDVQKQYIDNKGLEYNFNKPFAQFVFNNKFVFKRTMLGANYVFRTSGADGYILAKNYQKFDAFVAQYFLKGKLQVKLQMEDVFKSSKSINDMHTVNYDIRQKTIPNYRNVVLSLSYNFNRTHKRYLGTGAGSSEKDRL